jgi:hypothetical protein
VLEFDWASSSPYFSVRRHGFSTSCTLCGAPRGEGQERERQDTFLNFGAPEDELGTESTCIRGIRLGPSTDINLNARKVANFGGRRPLPKM